MSTFQFDEGAFEIPEHWSDRSVNILVNTAEGTPSFNVVVSREPLAGRDFATAMAEQLKEASKRLPSYVLLGKRDVTVASVPAMEIRSVFTVAAGKMYQHVVALAYYDKALIVTATTHFKDAEGCALAVARLLETLMLRRREE